MNNTTLINQVTRHIKPLPAIADRVLYLARQEPVDFKLLAQVIENDAVLSALVIRMANSPIYGLIRNRVETLDRAIVVLGQQHILDSTGLYITRILRQMTKNSWPKGDVNFWKHNIAVAIAARMLAERMNVSHTQLCFFAGLIHDIGKIALHTYDAAAYRDVMAHAEQSGVPLQRAELSAFGVDHATLSGAISRKWFLPVTCMKAVAHHHDAADNITVTVANIIRSANMLAKICGIGDSGNPYGLCDPRLLLPNPKFNETDIFDILDTLPGLVDELCGSVLGIHGISPLPSFYKENNPRPHIEVHTRRESDRLLLRYLLYTLGYYHGNDTGDTKIVIMDYMPEHGFTHESIIDFNTWRSQQPYTPHGELDIGSLRNWLITQIDHVEPSYA